MSYPISSGASGGEPALTITDSAPPNATSSPSSVKLGNSNIRSRQATPHFPQFGHSILPWGALKEKSNLLGMVVGNISGSTRLVELERKKPGEYLMHLIVFNFMQTGAKKLEQITFEKRVLIKKLN